jgi:hypothetical protein
MTSLSWRAFRVTRLAAAGFFGFVVRFLGKLEGVLGVLQGLAGKFVGG